MAIIFCDSDGKVLHTALERDPKARFVAPKGEAFTVYVDEDTGQKIAKEPKNWRFAGDNPTDGVRMRYVGKLSPSSKQAAEDKYVRAANEFAAIIAGRRAQQKLAMEVQSMFAISPTFPR